MRIPKIVFTIRIDPRDVTRLSAIAEAKGTKTRTLAAVLLSESIEKIDQKQTPQAA
jgi:predicted transcriptional regulator